MCYYFAKNRRNSRVIVKIWIFPLLIFFKLAIHPYIFHEYSIISPKIGQFRDCCQNMNLFRFKYTIWKGGGNTLLFYWKSAKFASFRHWLSKCKLSSGLMFYKYIFHYYYYNPIKSQLFRRKLAKFTANCRYMSFLLNDIFKRTILLLQWFYLQKYLKYYFAENRLNSWFIVKIWTLPVTFFLNRATFLRKYVIFTWKFVKIFMLVLLCFTYVLFEVTIKSENSELAIPSFAELLNKKF